MSVEFSEGNSPIDPNPNKGERVYESEGTVSPIDQKMQSVGRRALVDGKVRIPISGKQYEMELGKTYTVPEGANELKNEVTYTVLDHKTGNSRKVIVRMEGKEFKLVLKAEAKAEAPKIMTRLQRDRLKRDRLQKVRVKGIKEVAGISGGEKSHEVEEGKTWPPPVPPFDVGEKVNETAETEKPEEPTSQRSNQVDRKELDESIKKSLKNYRENVIDEMNNEQL